MGTSIFAIVCLDAHVHIYICSCVCCYFLFTCTHLAGQVEGAFTQGVGLYTMEQCVNLEGDSRTQRGQLYTTGPGTYKIPACSDIPVELNVTLLDKTSNPKAIFSSKVEPVKDMDHRHVYTHAHLFTYIFDFSPNLENDCGLS